MPPMRETRHLWVGNLPDSTTERDIIDYFQRYGRIDSVKILPKRSADGGQAAFVDFVDIRCAIKAHETPNRMGDRELRTDYNDPASSTLTRSHEESGRPRFERGGRGPADDGYSSRQSEGYSGSYGYKEGLPRREYDRGDTDERSSSRLTDENPDSFRRVARNPPKHKDSESGHSGSGTAGSDSGSDSSGSGDSDSESDSESSASETGHGGVKKPIALQIRNLSARSNDTTIRGGLYHEFKKHGDVGQIKVFGRDSNRHAIVYFKRREDVMKAMEACRGKMFLGLEMDISLYEGDEQEERSFHRFRRRSDTGGPGFNSADDVYQFNATRTIFVGNIERNTNSSELKRMFERYGEIVDIDIKKQGTNGAYAFIQYLDITHAVEAKKQMDRSLAGRNRLKIGFGKGMPTSTVWVGGLASNMTEDMLDRHFTRYGRIKGLGLDRKRGYCMVSFEHITDSTSAHNDLKQRTLFGKRVRIDYASRESQIFFYDYLVSTGQSEGRRYEPSPPPPMRPRGKMYDEPMRPRPGMRPGPKYHPYDHGYDRGPPFIDRGHRPYDDYFRGGGGYDSDDFGQELREYSRERAREREPDRRAEPPPRRRHHRGHPDMSMDSDGERYYPRPEHSDVWPTDGRRERGSPDVDPRDDGHGGRRGDKRRDGDKRVQERRVEDKRPLVRIRYDSEEDIENAEPPPPIEKKERGRDKSLRKKPIDVREEDENPDFYPTGYDKAYGNDEGKIRSVVTKRKVKTKEATSAEEDIIPPEELPVVPEVDTLAQKEERNADKPTKKIKHKEGKKKRKHKKSPEDIPPGEEPPRSNPPGPVDFDDGKYEAQETRVEKRTSPERKARKSDVVMKSVVVERSAAENSDNTRRDYEDTRRPRSPTPEEHLTSRKRVHSPERDMEYPRNVEDSRRVDNTRGGKNGRHADSSRHDNGHRYDEVKPKKQRASNEAPPPPPPPPPYNQSESKPKPDDSSFQASGAPRNAFVPTTANTAEPSAPSRSTFKQHPTEVIPSVTSGANGKRTKPASGHPSPTNSPAAAQTGSSTVPNSDDTLMELLRRHPVMWQGLLGLKNDSAAIQMHYVSGNSKLAEYSLPKATGATGPNGMTLPPVLRIAQRMRMEISQLEGVTKRMTFDNEHCLLLALPCGRDPLDVHAQTRALKNGFIAYLQQKQAAGIINIAQPGSQQASFVLHVFPPCDFTHSHLSRVAPNLLDSATDSGHLMVVVATV